MEWVGYIALKVFSVFCNLLGVFDLQKFLVQLKYRILQNQIKYFKVFNGN